MNTRTQEANERLNNLYQDLDKELEIDSPYLYSTRHALVCGFKSHNPKMYDAYWYHPDHLGSSSFITNTTGEISQHMEYLPFGETLVEEHLNSYNSPFKFNAKEYDAETGNYYYGARYYDPKWSTFLTPDPALESYPGISPYAYTLNNPVRYVDPTGMYVENRDTDYKINANGRTERVDENDGSEKNKTDTLFATDNKGDIDRSKSIELDKGVFASKKTAPVITNKGPMDIDEYDVFNDGKAKELFEFVHNNTNVEFSITGIDDKEGNNKLTTSGKERGEAGAPKLLIEGNFIRYSVHSHHYSSNASLADKNFASRVNSKFPNASLALFHKGSYIRYNSNGSIKPLGSNLKQIPVQKLFKGL